VAVGLTKLLVALVPVLVLEALCVGTDTVGVPKLLKLVVLEVLILMGPGPLGIGVLRIDRGIEGCGMTEVTVSVREGLKNVSVRTVVLPFVGIPNVLPDFVPLNVPNVS
jgi:hypothetical protein